VTIEGLSSPEEGVVMSLLRGRIAILAAAVAMGMGLLTVPGVSAAQTTSADLAVSVTPQNQVITIYWFQTRLFQFTTTVVNHGPSTASNVVLSETISGFVHGTNTIKVTAPMPCTVAKPSFAGFTVTCTQPSLPSGGTDKVVITFSGFAFHNTKDTVSGTVSSATPDPNIANNKASGTVSFICNNPDTCYLR
jgi:uncharacterized repeat protein (TIGR01451 family)